MPYLDKATMEEIAARVLRAYWKLPSAQETPWYVDPDLLLTDLLGLSIEFRQLSNDGLTLGMTSFEEMEIELPDCVPGEMVQLDGKTVLIDKELVNSCEKAGRRNYTVMHEGSHHILYMLFPREYGGGEKARSVIKYRVTNHKAKRNTEEWQVDKLASLLLMPEKLVKKNMMLVGLPDQLDYLNPVWRRQEYERFTWLSELMGVSKQALSYRMLQLGLLREDQRAHPNTLVEIWR